MPKVVTRDLPQQEDGLIQKVRQFLSVKGRINDLSKEESTLKAELSALVDAEGEPDEKGNLWYPLPQEVNGVVSLQRQRKVSQRLDEEVAQKILQDKKLTERCYKMVPVLDESEVMACLYEELLTEEDIDAMFPKSVSYAFIPSKK
jgi:hypothetical protein